MSSQLSQILIALDGVPAGILAATGKSYLFSYAPEYESATSSIPLSLSYPLQKGPWDHAFAGELPPYFEQLLPEGWLRDVAESAHLPMNTPLEKLTSLCRENLGAVEIYESNMTSHAPYDEARAWIARLKLGRKEAILFQNDTQKHEYPQWAHCFLCHEALPEPGYNANYHDDCSQQFFGSEKTPVLRIDSENLRKIAEDQLRRSESLTGVQPKFSAIFKDQHNALRDFHYIVKPEPKYHRIVDGVSYKDSAIAELAAMHFADLLGLEVSETALLYLQDGQPALISKRFDRFGGRKIHTEDFAQVLSVRDKYKGSHEKIASHLKKIADSAAKQHELSRFFKVILFNFLIGNADGHLKNYSVFHRLENGKPIYSLTPFYDILPVHLFASQDQDQLALTLNGKRRKIERQDFQELAIKLGIRIQVIGEFIEDFVANLAYYFETFEIFGVSAELIATHRKYVEQQMAILKNK